MKQRGRDADGKKEKRVSSIDHLLDDDCYCYLDFDPKKDSFQNIFETEKSQLMKVAKLLNRFANDLQLEDEEPVRRSEGLATAKRLVSILKRVSTIKGLVAHCRLPPEPDPLDEL